MSYWDDNNDTTRDDEAEALLDAKEKGDEFARTAPGDGLLGCAAVLWNDDLKAGDDLSMFQDPQPERWVIPTSITGLAHPLIIKRGGFHTGTQNEPGYYARHSTGENGLNLDGTWDKYGQGFESPEAALQVAKTTDIINRYGQRRDESDEYHAAMWADFNTVSRYSDERIEFSDFSEKFREKNPPAKWKPKEKR